MAASSSSALLVCLLVTAPLALNALVETRQPEVSPRLSPESHEEFYGKDYPHDVQPARVGVHKAFQYPYPIVQDSGEFEKDYVKDENDDSGEWKAQMQYDILRNKIPEQRAQADEAAKAFADEQAKYEEAQRKHEEAVNATGEAAADVEAAEGAEKEAEEKLKKLVGEQAASAGENVNGTGGAGEGDGSAAGNGTAVGGDLGDGVKKVEKEMDDLKGCQEQLAKAREDLKNAIEHKKKHEQERSNKKAAQAAADKAAMDKARAEGKEAEEAEAKRQAARNAAEMEQSEKDEALLAKAEAKAAAAKAEVKELEQRLTEEEESLDSADSAYEKDTKEVEKLEADIAKAGDKLRKLRQADRDGGVYSTKPKKSGAKASAASLLVILAARALVGIAGA